MGPPSQHDKSTQAIIEAINSSAELQIQAISKEIKSLGDRIVKDQGRMMQVLSGTSRLAPTLTTVGRQAKEFMSENHLVADIPAQGTAVLLEGMDLFDSDFEKMTERRIVQIFTPILRELVQEASLRCGYPLALVNCEKHLWMEDSDPLTAEIGPDLIVMNLAFAKYSKTKSDEEFDGKDFLFATPSCWTLRDSADVFIEWERGMDNEAFGQCINMCDRIAHNSLNDPVYKDRTKETFMILADPYNFDLIRSEGSRPASCLKGSWRAPGSREAIINFIVERTRTNVWLHALTRLCSEFSVTAVQLSSKEKSFLGLGADGRVFQVESAQGRRQALKLAVEEIGSARIQDEFENFQALKE
jgi:hypothetical protein